MTGHTPSQLACGAVLALLLAPAPGCCNCDSGQIRLAHADLREHRVVFRRDHSPTLWLVDSGSPRELPALRLGYTDPFLITNDGRWVVASPVPYTSRVRLWGDPLILLDAVTATRFDIRMPFHILDEASIDYYRRHVGLATEQGGQPIAIATDPVRAHSLGDDGICLGPVSGEYFRWSPSPLPPRWTRGRAPGHMFDIDPSGTLLLEDHAQPSRVNCKFLVELPYDGRAPRRTVWVCPNGTVVEIARQNDVPARILCGIVGIPAMVIPMQAGAILSMWRSALETLQIDSEAVSAAEARLSEAVGLRQAEKRNEVRSTAQPTTDRSR